MSAGTVLEEAHEAAARAVGRISLMLARRKASKEGISLSIGDLLRAVKELRKIVPE